MLSLWGIVCRILRKNKGKMGTFVVCRSMYQSDFMKSYHNKCRTVLKIGPYWFTIMLIGTGIPFKLG